MARGRNNFLADGQYFLVDILRECFVFYELDDRPLAEPKRLSPADALRVAREHFDRQGQKSAARFLELARVAVSSNWENHAAFLLHQAVETAYSCLLLTLANYSPPSHNLKFLRGLAEDHDRRVIEAWPRDQHRFTAWYNILNGAYVKARYSKHFEITEEALAWLLERTEHLHRLVEAICKERLAELEREAGVGRRRRRRRRGVPHSRTCFNPRLRLGGDLCAGRLPRGQWRVSIHASAKEATAASRASRTVSPVSIHASAKEATLVVIDR